jgi:hypothetical protein
MSQRTSSIFEMHRISKMEEVPPGESFRATARNEGESFEGARLARDEGRRPSRHISDRGVLARAYANQQLMRSLLSWLNRVAPLMCGSIRPFVQEPFPITPYRKLR